MTLENSPPVSEKEILPPISEKEGKQWPQYLVVFTATIAVLSTGLHTGWPSPSLPKLMSIEYPFEVTNEEASYITIIGSLGNFVGGFTGYVFLDKIGRRKTILLISVPQFMSFVLIILSYQLMELLYVARFIGGMAEGMTGSIIFLYIGEIAEPTIRGTLCTLISITWYSGVFFINVIGSALSIKDTAFSILALPVLFVLLFWKMPESPYYLLMKNKDDEAVKVLKFLRRKSNVCDELISLKADVNRQMSETGTFKDIFTIDSNRKAFLLTTGGRFFQTASGVPAFNLYLQLLLKDATDSLSPQQGSTIILLLHPLLTILSTFIVDKLGRKPLLLFSTCGCCLNLTIQTIFFILKEHTNVDVSVIDWFPLMMMIIHIIVYAVGLGVMVNVLTSEIFSTSIKSKVTCLVNGSYALYTLFITKYYQATADTFGLTFPFCTFAILSFLGVLFFYFLLPETKGKSLEEIQQELKGRGRTKTQSNVS